MQIIALIIVLFLLSGWVLYIRERTIIRTPRKIRMRWVSPGKVNFITEKASREYLIDVKET